MVNETNFLMMRPAQWILILFLLLDACVEPFDIQLTSSQQVMMVDGMITDQPGPYTVKIFKTLPLTGLYDNIPWVKGAQVSIFDDLGVEDVLLEVTPGNYQTTSIQGVVGRTYHLRITTQEGLIYESIPDKMIAVGGISNLEADFEQREFGADINFSNSTNGYNIFLNADILPEQNGLVRWRWTGTFEIKAYPELRTKAISTPTSIVIIPDPPRCSGYIRSGSGTQQVGECTCCYCWVTQYSQVPLLSDKKFVNDNLVSKFKIAFVQANRRYLYDKYYFEVEQMSVSQSVYDFWKKVEAQENLGSNLFQTPAPATTGNILAISPGAPAATGVFGASAVKSRSVCNRQELI